MKRRAVLVWLAVLGVGGWQPAGTAQTRPRQLLPVDEGARDPSFLAFRRDLLRAIERKDSGRVLAAVDPKVRVHFGEGGGIGEFRKMWKPTRKDSRLWGVLKSVVTLGGSFERSSGAHRVFWAPYVYIKFPEDLDSFEYWAIIEKDVAVRSRPEARAPVMQRLSYALVPAESLTGNTKWVKVKLPEGPGFVPAASIRSPVDYRAAFEKVRGKWKLTALVAGE